MPSLSDIVAATFQSPHAPSSNEALLEWLSQQWSRYEAADPLEYTPTKAAYVEQAWPPEFANLYAAIYPPEVAENCLGFHVYSWYTSSIHQDLIRDGVVDLQYFVPEDKDEGLVRLAKLLPQSELLTDELDIQGRLRTLNLPPGVEWIPKLDFVSVLLSGDAPAFELVAETSDGYLTVFAVDG